MSKIGFVIVLLLLLSLTGSSQPPTSGRDPRWQTRGSSVSASIPGSCTANRDVWICTNCAAGAAIYYCIGGTYQAQGGGGTAVNVNGASVSNPNFNAATPAAEAGYTNIKFQVSGSSVSAEISAPIPYQSSAVNTTIAAANIVASTAGAYGYHVDWEIELTTIGSDCTGTTTLIPALTFQSPNQAGPAAQNLATVQLAVNGNGTVGPIFGGSTVVYTAASTALKIGVPTYTAGAGCTTAPTYQLQAWASSLGAP